VGWLGAIKLYSQPPARRHSLAPPLAGRSASWDAARGKLRAALGDPARGAAREAEARRLCAAHRGANGLRGLPAGAVTAAQFGRALAGLGAGLGPAEVREAARRADAHCGLRDRYAR
jgi:hypothetical protein